MNNSTILLTSKQQLLLQLLLKTHTNCCRDSLLSPLRLSLIYSATFSLQKPTVISQHIFNYSSLIPVFHLFNFLVEEFTMFITYFSLIWRKKNQGENGENEFSLTFLSRDFCNLIKNPE